MNRPRPGRFCVACGQDITILAFGQRRDSESYMDAMQRMTASGLDDLCQRRRQRAAETYIRACDNVRTLIQMGATLVGKAPRDGSLLQIAMDGVADADARCVQLKMWPATRQAPRGEQ